LIWVNRERGQTETNPHRLREGVSRTAKRSPTVIDRCVDRLSRSAIVSSNPVAAQRVALVHQIFKPGKQGIDIGIEAIGRKAGAGGAVNSKRAEQGLRTVIAAAQGYSIAVEVTAHLLCRKAFDREGYDATTIARIGRSHNAQPSDRRQAIEQTACQS